MKASVSAAKAVRNGGFILFGGAAGFLFFGILFRGVGVLVATAGSQTQDHDQGQGERQELAKI